MIIKDNVLIEHTSKYHLYEIIIIIKLNKL